MYWCLRGEYNDVVRLSGGLKEGKDLMANVVRLSGGLKEGKALIANVVRLSGGLKKGKDLMANGEMLILRLLLCSFNFKQD